MKSRFALLLGVCVTAVLFAAVPAGAAPNVGNVTVSNPQPARDSAIDVKSSGWKPGGVVSITLSGTQGVLVRATADSKGTVRARVPIPEHAPRFVSLAVVGNATSGVPQQIVTNLSVVGARSTPASPRPWVAVFALLAIATALLLMSVRAEREPLGTRLTPVAG